MTPPEPNTLFDDWLRQHAAVLHHVVNGFAAGADRHDLMQEILLALWRALPAYRGQSQASTFIYRVAHNTALTWRRSYRNYARRLDRLETIAADELAPADGEADAREREALANIYEAIRRLPPLDRSLVLLHLDGLTYAEIAEIHGLTESNVGVRLLRLKQKLTTLLEGIAHELR